VQRRTGGVNRGRKGRLQSGLTRGAEHRSGARGPLGGGERGGAHTGRRVEDGGQVGVVVALVVVGLGEALAGEGLLVDGRACAGVGLVHRKRGLVCAMIGRATCHDG